MKNALQALTLHCFTFHSSLFTGHLSLFFRIFAPMKYLSLLLSIYLWALTAVPCSDMPNIEQDNVRYSTISQADTSSEHEHSHSDICSPFCVCACCQVLIVFPFSPTFTLQVPITNVDMDYNTHYTYKKVMAYYGAIWTPPKV